MKRYVLTALLLLLTISPAWGHKVYLLSSFDGESITGEAYFSTGDPVANSPVTLESDGHEIARGETDSQGAFSVPLAQEVTSVRVTVNAGAGHVAHEDLVREVPLPTSQETGSQTAASTPSLSTEELRKALATEIAPVRQMVAELHKAYAKPDLSRIVGGIGCIVGMVGAFLWGRSARG